MALDAADATAIAQKATQNIATHYSKPKLGIILNRKFDRGGAAPAWNCEARATLAAVQISRIAARVGARGGYEERAAAHAGDPVDDGDGGLFFLPFIELIHHIATSLRHFPDQCPYVPFVILRILEDVQTFPLGVGPGVSHPVTPGHSFAGHDAHILRSVDNFADSVEKRARAEHRGASFQDGETEEDEQADIYEESARQGRGCTARLLRIQIRHPAVAREARHPFASFGIKIPLAATDHLHSCGHSAALHEAEGDGTLLRTFVQ